MTMEVYIINYETISENRFSEIANMKLPGGLTCVNGGLRL
jgi:hypothetical protein